MRAHEVGADGATDVTFGRFDLDDLGAHVGQHQAAVRTGQHVAHLDDADAREWRAHARLFANASTTVSSGMSAVKTAATPKPRR